MKYMEGFEASDHEKILSCLSDDVTWFILGMFHVSRKEKLDNEIENENFVGSRAIKISRLTEENNVVIAEGNI